MPRTRGGGAAQGTNQGSIVIRMLCLWFTSTKGGVEREGRAMKEEEHRSGTEGEGGEKGGGRAGGESLKMDLA